MTSLTKEDINKFALSKNCSLSKDELDFTYTFIKNNWQNILKNPNSFNIDKYKNYYSEQNFIKVKKVFQEYFHKFSLFL